MASDWHSFDPILLLVSGPAGSGKTTVCEGILKDFSDSDDNRFSRGLRRVITATTRPPRDDETDSVDYFFFSPEEFQAKVEGGEFYEHAKVFQNRYGTLKSEIQNGLDSGQDLLLNIDVQGASTIRQCAQTDDALRARLVTVFITPSDIETLRDRLTQRAQNSDSDLQQRLDVAREEMKQQVYYDYSIPSGSKEEDLEALKAIFVAAKLKVQPFE